MKVFLLAGYRRWGITSALILPCAQQARIYGGLRRVIVEFSILIMALVPEVDTEELIKSRHLFYDYLVPNYMEAVLLPERSNLLKQRFAFW